MVDFGVNKSHETVPNLPSTMSPDVQGRTVRDTAAQKEARANEQATTEAIKSAAPKGMKEIINELTATFGKKEEAGKTEDSFKSSREELNKIIEEMNGVAKSMSNEVRFEISEELGELVVQVVDTETDEVIRTIPPEYLVELRVKFREQVGMVLDKEL